MPKGQSLGRPTGQAVLGRTRWRGCGGVCLHFVCRVCLKLGCSAVPTGPRVKDNILHGWRIGEEAVPEGTAWGRGLFFSTAGTGVRASSSL